NHGDIFRVISTLSYLDGGIASVCSFCYVVITVINVIGLGVDSVGMVKIANVPSICQHREMPTGCEATALTMLLNWAGESLTNHEVVERLPKGDKVELIDGIWRGGDPHTEFVGNPYEDEGCFGVFEGPILKTIDA